MTKDRINWNDGSWKAKKGTESEAEIIITSDWAPIREFDNLIAEKPESVYGDLLPELRNADMRITNLECPLVDDAEPIWKSGSVLKGRKEHIKGLASVPFEVVTMANNHVFDYGTSAFRETCSLLNSNNIYFVGAGENREESCKPLILEINNLKLGIVNFGEGEDLLIAGKDPGVFGWDIDSVCDNVKELKEQVNTIIVICHAGIEYIPFPPPYIVSAFQQIVEAGADLIVSHHPHVPQGVQLYKGVPICYSQGNFVFYQYNELKFRKIGYMVKAGLSQDGLSDIKIIPYEILSDRLNLLKEAKLRLFMKSMDEISRPLDDSEGVNQGWYAFLKYYGVEGFKKEINNILDKVDEELPKGAAMFRNRMTTPQHQHHLIDLMSRIIEGKLDDAPEWAMKITERWFKESVKDS